MLCFNTSHVTLYLEPAGKHRLGFTVSIHLMLLFITEGSMEEVTSNLFQYISCYSLSGSSFNISRNKYRFNTSHVTLYPDGKVDVMICLKFQYISCYSLSLFTAIVNVPTVTFRFQYISCYSLSLVL